jgi:DNA polymerase
MITETDPKRLWKLWKGHMTTLPEMTEHQRNILKRWGFLREEIMNFEMEQLVKDGMKGLIIQIKECNKCELAKTASRKVIGRGNPNPTYLFIGEAPGETEDQNGIPFSGASAGPLNEMIAYMGLKETEYAIINAVKCHPPENRTPTPYELGECHQFLRAQVHLLNPRIILLLGEVASTAFTVERLKRGKPTWFSNGRLVIKVFHPAALLYSPERIPLQKQYLDNLKEFQ